MQDVLLFFFLMKAQQLKKKIKSVQRSSIPLENTTFFSSDNGIGCLLVNDHCLLTAFNFQVPQLENDRLD